MIDKLMHFLAHSPTSYHAVAEVKQTLLAHKFEELTETAPWKIKKGHSYFYVKEGSLIAFTWPQKSLEKALIMASHTDSPALKLKPHASFIKEGLQMLGVEVYGAPLLSSWLNRDLGIAGKVLYVNKNNQPEEALVNISTAPVTIPQVAIHLDRKVNDEGLLLNKQEHLTALASLTKPKKDSYLEALLAESLPLKELLAHDLFLYPLEAPRLIGYKDECLAAYRLDSLASVYAILQAFIAKRTPSPHLLKMIAFWDHEEIGSQSTTGAESPFFSHTLERIALSAGLDREKYLRLLSNALCLSVDLGHAVHPNYPDKHDPQHKNSLGQGVLIKTNAQKRYATDISSARLVIEVAKKHKIPFTSIVARNDIPSGTTIGPIQAGLTGISTVDLGIGQLSMHSARELIATADYNALFRLLSNMFDT